MGIIEKALALGARGTGANMWANGRWTARIPLGDIGQSLSPFPFVLMLGQDDNERIMGDKLRDYGIAVQWSTELVALEQHPDHVDATLKRPDGTTRKIRAAWVAGCDGSRSPVREMSGITFPGAPLRAHVLRRRHRGHRADEAGRAQRLSVAGRVSPVLPDARQGPLAGDRHPARDTAAEGRSHVRRGGALDTAAKRGPSSLSRRAAGSRPTASITAPRSDSATGAASCSATPRTSTARWARRA